MLMLKELSEDQALKLITHVGVKRASSKSSSIVFVLESGSELMLWTRKLTGVTDSGRSWTFVKEEAEDNGG